MGRWDKDNERSAEEQRLREWAEFCALWPRLARVASIVCIRCGDRGWGVSSDGPDEMYAEEYCDCAAGDRRRVLDGD